MREVLLSAFVCLASLSVRIAVAQQPVSLSKADSAFADTLHVKTVRARSFSPFAAGTLSNFVSNVSVSSFFEEGVNGKIELQGKFDQRWSGGLSVNQKIGKTVNVATPLDLTGISPGTTVEFNLQHFIWKPQFTLSRNEIASLNKVQQAYAARNNIPDWRTVGLREMYLNGTDVEKQAAVHAFGAGSFKQPFVIDVKAGFTKTAYTYTLDSVMLSPVDVAFVTPTFTLSLVKATGAAFKVTGYLALSFNYNESYTPSEDITFVLPFGSTRNLYSNTAAFGKPAKSRNSNITFEWRRNILSESEEVNMMNVAISPSVTVGVASKKLSLFLPVYLIRGSDGKGKLLDNLQGGVRLGYITSTQSGKLSNFKDGFIAQLIITQPLDFLSKF